MPKKTLEPTEALRTVLQEVAGRTAVKNDRKKNKSYPYEIRILSLILRGNSWGFLSNIAHRSKDGFRTKEENHFEYNFS